MSGAALWAILGPVVALIGAALLVWGIARRRRR
jgi:cytochrome c-type biogenesis protein CcmH/NrfF